MPLNVTIVIPTFDRETMVDTAVEAALGQSHADVTVIVVDDGSRDRTRGALERFFDHPRLSYARLASNVGAAQAKNAGLALAAGEAVTFHDADDIPHRDKVLRQARVIANQTIGADPCLNWRLSGREAGTSIQIGAVLVHHEMILPDGDRVEIRRTLSLVDDFFPNLQMAAGVPGDWTHVNSALFHRSVFDRLGGFLDCIEEDREFRNRLIMSGEVLWVIPEILLTKIETTDSLTKARATDYDSPRRVEDRAVVWEKVERWFRSREVDPAPIDLRGVELAELTNPHLCDLDRAAAHGLAMEPMLRRGGPILQGVA